MKFTDIIHIRNLPASRPARALWIEIAYTPTSAQYYKVEAREGLVD